MTNLMHNTEEKVLDLVRKFVIASGSKHATRVISLDAELDTELGIDSLGRVELFHRLEQAFNVKLPAETLTWVQTVADLIHAVQNPLGDVAISKEKSVNTRFQDDAKLDLHSAHTLIDVLQRHVRQHPQQVHIYLYDDKGHESTITYEQLWVQAEIIANALKQRGIGIGDTVAIMLPSSADFFYAFFGVLLCGGIPVPIYPSMRSHHIEEYAHTAAKILQNAVARVLISLASVTSINKTLKVLVPSLMGIVSVTELMEQAAVSFDFPNITADHPALIQYTSGSTGSPKGVLLLQRNIMANIRAITQAMQITLADSCVSWLPLYHDMGLMSWLLSLYVGMPFVCLSPLAFTVRPEQWLWQLHYHRGTISAAPNFAYEMCVTKTAANSLEGLDLSAWRCALNGAEAVNPDTLERFSKKFASYGFSETTFFPAYGLAENTVCVLTPEPGSLVKVDRIMRESFEQHHKAIAAATTVAKKDTLAFVCCGKPIADHAIRLVNDAGEVITAERQVGVLQFQGPSAMQGYYHNPSATQAIYADGWWSSGDLAYKVAGEFYIVGRKKDVIIKAGRNFYAEEIEAVVNEVPGIRKGRVVAFGVSDATFATERIVIVAEATTVRSKQKIKLQEQIIAALVISLGYPPDQVVIVAPGTISKTSSGKLQRSRCRQAYLNGELNKPKAQFVKTILSYFSRGLKSSAHDKIRRL